MKTAVLKIVIISLLLNVLLLGGAYLLLKRNDALRASLEATRDALVTELNGVKITTAQNGSDIASIQVQMVTHDMVRQGDRQIMRRLDEMDIQFNKRITDITLLNTVTDYKIKDTLIIVTDTSYVTQYKDKFLDFKSEMFPELGYSQTRIIGYDSLMMVGRLVKDTTKTWPFRWAHPRIAELDVSNLNPNTRITYLRTLKLQK